MKVQYPPHVSMKEFLRTGQFGPIQLGDTVQSLKTTFGEPSQWGNASLSQPVPLILKYGDIEFHITSNTKYISLIFCDSFKKLHLGAKLPFDHWFFDGHPSLEFVEDELNKVGFGFHRKDTPYEPTTFLLCLDSGVELIFSNGGNPYIESEVPCLFGFQYSGKKS